MNMAFIHGGLMTLPVIKPFIFDKIYVYLGVFAIGISE